VQQNQASPFGNQATLTSGPASNATSARYQLRNNLPHGLPRPPPSLGGRIDGIVQTVTSIRNDPNVVSRLNELANFEKTEVDAAALGFAVMTIHNAGNSSASIAALAVALVQIYGWTEDAHGGVSDVQDQVESVQARLFEAKTTARLALEEADKASLRDYVDSLRFKDEVDKAWIRYKISRMEYELSLYRKRNPPLEPEHEAHVLLLFPQSSHFTC
jgi:hypothetical protein